MAVLLANITTGWAGSGSTFSLGVTATSGNLLFVGLGYPQPADTMTLGDGINTYTSIGSAVDGGGFSSTFAWYAPNITGGSLTLNFTASGSTFWPVIVAEFSGVATTSPLKANASGTVTSGSTILSGSLSASASAGDLVVAIAHNYYGPTGWSAGATNPSGFAVPSSPSGANDHGDGAGNTGLGYAVLASGYSGAVSLTPASTVYGNIIAAAFAAAGGGGGSPSVTQRLALLGVGS